MIKFHTHKGYLFTMKSIIKIKYIYEIKYKEK